MSNTFEFGIGMVVGSVVAAIVFGITYQGSDKYVMGTEAQQRLEVCEKSLPRNEYCELIAVRKDGK